MEIEKNIYLIKKLTNRKNPFKYPWPDMKVGDSFYIEGYSNRKQSVISTIAGLYAKRNNPSAKFATRKYGSGLRVYRIK